MLTERLAQMRPLRIGGIPPVQEVVLWLVLVLIFASPLVLVMAVPAAGALQVWETHRGHGFAAWPWLRHLCEMTVAMYAGMLVYMAVARPALVCVVGGGLFGGAVSYSGMVLAMIVPMVALMHIEGHSRRMAEEMTLAMVLPMVVCFGLLGLGICPLVPFLAWLTPTSVYSAAHDGMLLGMVALMVVRRGMYAEMGQTTGHVCSGASGVS
jgi:hypothetical protein